MSEPAEPLPRPLSFEPSEQPDVLVFGATAPGVTAAVAAAGTGATVRVVEPGSHVGGMVSGGLSWTDIGRTEVVGGLVRRFYELVGEHYGTQPFAVRGPEPHVAEEILVDMLEQAGAELCLGEPLIEVVRGAGRIEAIRTSQARHRAAVFVDASYEGDVMAGAGVPYRVGREPRSLHGEGWAGRQPAYRPGAHNFPVLLSPFWDGASRQPTDLLPLVCSPELDELGWPLERLGEGDGALQSYAFRLCMTNRRENQLELEQPVGYDPERFELLRRYLAAVGERIGAADLLGLVPDLLPGGKCDVNSIGPLSLNLLDGTNRSYPDGDAEVRRRVVAAHRDYSLQYLWFLRSADGVPEHISTTMRRWSLCADEFGDTGGVPHQLYVREGRRMVGERVLTEHDLLDARRWPDCVARGSYNIDLREHERTWRYLPEYFPTPAVFNEGYVSVPLQPYDIPYAVLVPQREHCTNLIVPVCCSASHVAFGSLRTEPTMMALGEAGGVAAAMAAMAGSAVQEVVVSRVQAKLAAWS